MKKRISWKKKAQEAEALIGEMQFYVAFIALGNVGLTSKFKYPEESAKKTFEKVEQFFKRWDDRPPLEELKEE